jgi:uncharacterized membrane protein YdjX (TVP38/TMEM64 family)
MSKNPATQPGHMWKWVALAALLVLLVAAFNFLPLRAKLQELLAWIDSLGGWAPLLYVLTYAVLTVSLVPGSIMTIGAGALFGLVLGSFCALIGATLGAALAFLIGRHLARERVSRRFHGNPRFDLVDKAVAEEGWKIVGLTRLSPVFPFVLLNYAFSLTAVPFRDYVAATCIGMVPGTVMYVYLGWMAEAGTDAESRTTIQWVIYALGFVATVAVTVLVTRIARRGLMKHFKSAEMQERT